MTQDQQDIAGLKLGIVWLLMIGGVIVPGVVVCEGTRLLMGTVAPIDWLGAVFLGIAVGLFFWARRKFTIVRRHDWKSAYEATMKGFRTAAIAAVAVGVLGLWGSHVYVWFAGYLLFAAGYGVLSFVNWEAFTGHRTA